MVQYHKKSSDGQPVHKIWLTLMSLNNEAKMEDLKSYYPCPFASMHNKDSSSAKEIPTKGACKYALDPPHVDGNRINDSK